VLNKVVPRVRLPGGKKFRRIQSFLFVEKAQAGRSWEE
jgi:hypothetical protein